MGVISIEGRSLLDAFAIGEDYKYLDYNELVGGSVFSDYSKFPVWAGYKFTNGSISHAAGRYQFEPGTWNPLQIKLNLPDFSPDSQDLAAWDLAQTVYVSITGRVLQDDLLQGEYSHLVDALHSTWTSISSAIIDRFKGAYTARQWVLDRINTASLPPMTWQDAIGSIVTPSV